MLPQAKDKLKKAKRVSTDLIDGAAEIKALLEDSVKKISADGGETDISVSTILVLCLLFKKCVCRT